MSIVDWGRQQDKLIISSGTETDIDLMTGILSLDLSDDRWNGLVVYKGPRNVRLKKKHTSVELRKTLDGVCIKIVIGHQGTFPVGPGKDIRIGANGRMFFTIDQMQEMNLAILEGRNVLDNYRKHGFQPR